ncbi:sucrase ferredoxin [Streptomyces cacaoi]
MSTCAAVSRTLDEPLAGTAATARTWLLVEQPGPWGKQALTQSRLDAALGAELERSASAHGARVALIRRPARADGADGPAATPGAPRRVFLARTLPGNAWIRTALLAEDALGTLRDLDFAALDGDRGPAALPAGWVPYTGDPLALVCTNGRRDRCCAVLGRPLAARLAAMGGADVWEITHIGGHRFAPTLLTLPGGYAYGRLDAVRAADVLDAVRAGRVPTEGCRGRSTWDAPGQRAELAVREHTGEPEADALTVEAVLPAEADRTDGTARAEGTTPAEGATRVGGTTRAAEAVRADPPRPRRWSVTVAHRDGRRWHLTLSEQTAGTPRPASCGAEPGPAGSQTVERIVSAAHQAPAAAGTPASPSVTHP